MIDANFEIDSLRSRLRLRNLSEAIVDSICDDVSREISHVTTDMLANAVEEAVQAGQSVGSEEFIEEVRAIRSGSSFEVFTDSGRTDFSEPPFPMLPKLLKNGKVASDGSVYKVIPIRSKGNKGTNRHIGVTTEAAIKGINDARRQAKEDRDAMKEKLNTSLSPNAMKGMSTFAAMQSISNSRKSTTKIREKSTEPVISFRTASSKQDAGAKWVHPGKRADMTSTLYNINNKLHNDIDNVIQAIIRKHEDMY